MKQEDKQLLLKDLCARLPYDVEAQVANNIVGESKPLIINKPLTLEDVNSFVGNGVVIDIKPYLRPMSSMTEEECIKLSRLYPYTTDAWKYIKTSIPLYIANLAQFDFFHSHHLDWRGLIPKGLAIEVTEENNPYD